MAKKITHVRFRLTELIKAVEKATDAVKGVSVQEAFSYYWNWATNRGWSIVAVSNQMDPNRAILALENSPQLEMRNEEFWNVLWVGEDTDGSCDLVEEMRNR